MELIGIVDEETVGAKVRDDPFHTAEDAAGHNAAVQTDGGTECILRVAGKDRPGAAAAPGKKTFVHLAFLPVCDGQLPR